MKGKYIAIGVIILLIGFNATGSIFREVELKNISTVSFDGNILYVGGSGPNNYTKIQDAINDSFNGDTVFVYNGTYYEHNMTIDKSINLIGENRDNTIIYGTNISNILIIIADWVNVSGFTLRNSNQAIELISGNLSISNNNISSNGFGISSIFVYEEVGSGIVYIKNNLFWNNSLISVMVFGVYGFILNVYDNLFREGECGILVTEMYDSKIYSNIFENIDEAVVFAACSNFTFKNNYINNCYIGLVSMGLYNSDIILNNFINNDNGLQLSGSGNKITQNNFINIDNSAIFSRIAFLEFLAKCWMKVWSINSTYSEPIRILSKNTWNGNYWNESRTKPYLIRGEIHLIFLPRRPIPFFNIDWHPAQKPYDI